MSGLATAGYVYGKLEGALSAAIDFLSFHAESPIYVLVRGIKKLRIKLLRDALFSWPLARSNPTSVRGRIGNIELDVPQGPVGRRKGRARCDA
jgi:hypothetical protein